jgi:hypothetical protein
LGALKAETADLQSLRDNPMRGIERRLDEMMAEIRAMGHRAAASPALPISQQWSPTRRKTPVMPTSGGYSIPDDQHSQSSWLVLGVLVAGGILLVILLYLALDALLPMIVSGFRGF